jgi:electron transfer flavoprotein beta subunit
MRILVCVKRVPLTGGKMVLTADEQALETRHLGFTVSPHEECGVEEAVRICEANGGEVTVLTLGPPEAEEQIRDMLALGAERGILLATDGEEFDAQATAQAIVSAIGSDDYDLIVFGNESADSGGFQVGIRIAHASVLEGINLPRYPSVPAKLRARRKPVETIPVQRLAPRLERLRLLVPPGQGKRAEILGSGPEAAPAVVEVMRELGVA